MEEKKHTRIIENNEIDLAELFGVVLRGWKTVLFFLVFFTCLGLLYGLLKTPLYQASTRVIEADSADLAALNQYRSSASVIESDSGGLAQIEQYEGYNVSPGYAYYRFKESVRSLQNFQRFSNKNKLEEKTVDAMSLSDFSFSENKDDSYKSLTIDYRYNGDEQGARFLNDYISWTAKKVSDELVSNFMQLNSLKVDELETRRDLLKKKLVSEREARVFELMQAINTADSLGIKKPTLPENLNRREDNVAQGLYVGVKGNSWQLPLYFMGSDVLNAEKEVVQQQIDKGLSSEEIRDLDQEIAERKNTSAKYKSLLNNDGNEKLSNMEVVNIVGPAYQPTEPVQPKKKIIVIFAMFIGVIVGTLTVFLHRLIKINRSK